MRMIRGTKTVQIHTDHNRMHRQASPNKCWDSWGKHRLKHKAKYKLVSSRVLLDTRDRSMSKAKEVSTKLVSIQILDSQRSSIQESEGLTDTRKNQWTQMHRKKMLCLHKLCRKTCLWRVKKEDWFRGPSSKYSRNLCFKALLNVFMSQGNLVISGLTRISIISPRTNNSFKKDLPHSLSRLPPDLHKTCAYKK